MNIHFNIIDYVWLGIAILCAIYGYVRGFVNSFLSMLGVCFSFIMAVLYYQKLSVWIMGQTGLNTMSSNIVSFIVIFIITKYALVLVGGFLNFLANVRGIHHLNKWIGVIFGIFEWTVISIVLIYLAHSMDMPKLNTLLATSYVSHLVSIYTPDIIVATVHFFTHLTKG